MTQFLDEFIAIQRQQRPEACAFRFNNDEISYRQLTAASQRLAGHLNAMGIGPGSLVGVQMDKSLELPVVLFGILASGAGYVALDTLAPAERIAQIAGASALNTVFVSDRLLDPMRETLSGVRLVATGRAASGALTLANLMATEPLLVEGHVSRSPDDIAYVIFSSGSTGVPKGIVHTHRSAVSYASMSADLYGLTGSDRLANVTPLQFDMSTFEFFAGPSRGACTILVPEGVTRFPASLGKLLKEELPTTLYAVPFALIELVEKSGLKPGDIPSLRWIIHAGDVMAPSAFEATRAFFPDTRFSNSYGPAEVNQVTFHHYSDEPVNKNAPLPIGIACPHAQCQVDSQTGELLVATSARMRGYLNDPALTQKCLVDLAASDGNIQTFFRTGDVVKENDRGTLTYIGRMDRQVKVRGFRVSLEEVEQAVSSHKEIAEAAAVLAEDGKCIRAFARFSTGNSISEGYLLRQLRSKLPAYAIPASVQFIHDFPRTSSDKIDRNALKKGLSA